MVVHGVCRKDGDLSAPTSLPALWIHRRLTPVWEKYEEHYLCKKWVEARRLWDRGMEQLRCIPDHPSWDPCQTGGPDIGYPKFISSPATAWVHYSSLASHSLRYLQQLQRVEHAKTPSLHICRFPAFCGSSISVESFNYRSSPGFLPPPNPPHPDPGPIPHPPRWSDRFRVSWSKPTNASNGGCTRSRLPAVAQPSPRHQGGAWAAGWRLDLKRPPSPVS